MSVKKLPSSRHVVTAPTADEDDGTFSRLVVLASSILINACNSLRNFENFPLVEVVCSVLGFYYLGCRGRLDFLSLYSTRQTKDVTDGSQGDESIRTTSGSIIISTLGRILPRCSPPRRPFLLRAVIVKALRRRHLLPAFAPSRKRSEQQRERHHPRY